MNYFNKFVEAAAPQTTRDHSVTVWQFESAGRRHVHRWCDVSVCAAGEVTCVSLQAAGGRSGSWAETRRRTRTRRRAGGPWTCLCSENSTGAAGRLRGDTLRCCCSGQVSGNTRQARVARKLLSCSVVAEKIWKCSRVKRKRSVSGGNVGLKPREMILFTCRAAGYELPVRDFRIKARETGVRLRLCHVLK